MQAQGGSRSWANHSVRESEEKELPKSTELRGLPSETGKVFTKRKMINSFI
jgi:hypothetical protein